MVKSLPSNARDTDSITGWGTKIPNATRQLSPCAATTETVHSGALVPQLERSLHAATKSPHAETKSPHATTKDPACHKDDPVCRS